MIDDTTTLPFTDTDLAFWRAEIKLARQKREEVASTNGWDENLKRYSPKPAKDGTGKMNGDINTGVDFADVETKKAALFYDTPQVSLSVTTDREVAPAGPQQPALQLSTLVLWQQELLNELLGPQHANVKPTVLKAIFDCLCPAGVGPVTVGYQVTMRTISRTVPMMDPLTGQPIMHPVPALDQAMAALGLAQAPMPEPMMEQVEVEIPIHERWFVSRFSPKALLIPASFRDTDFVRAPWMGKEFRKATSQLKREFHLPSDWKGGTAEDGQKPYFENNETDVSEESAGDPYVTGVELYYRKQVRAEEEVHPDALVKLVLVDGQDVPLVHVDCPYQDFDPETGEMSADSLTGFVDRPLVLRDLSDSAWIASDCAVTAQLTKEGEKYRTQILETRDGSKQVIAFDSAKMDPTATDKIKKANGVIWVPLQEGALAQGKDSIMTQVAQPSMGRENYTGMEVIAHDRERILAIGANQAGTQTKGRRTATENSIVQRNVDARFEQERQRVLEWFLDIVSAFDTLVLRYADARTAVKILGDMRGQLWAEHKQHLFGGYGYTLQVDSGKYLDVEADRRQAMQEYNQLRQDPLVNPKVLLKSIAEKMGHDPSEFIVEPKEPPKELKASFSFKGEDLNPMNPAFALVVKVMRQSGWDISPEDVQTAQGQASAMSGGMAPVSGVGAAPGGATPMTMHPGSAPKAPTINQHFAEETGDRTGPKVDAGSVM